MKKTVMVRGRKYWKSAKELDAAKKRKPKAPINQIVYGDDGCEMLAKKRKRG